MLYEQIDPWRPEKRFVQFELFSYMAEQSKAWEKWNLLLSGKVLAQNFNDAVQFSDEQSILVAVMRVKRGPSHIGAADDIADRDRAVVFFPYQFDQRCAQ